MQKRLEKLESILKARKWSHADLAVRVNCAGPYISQIIRGDRTASPELCEKIIAVFEGEITLEDVHPDLAATVSRIQELEAQSQG